MEKITFSKKNLIIGLLLLFTATGFAQTQTFSTSGTFVVPAGVTSITVEAWGGGGKGGDRTSTGAAGGGGGGGYAKDSYAVTPGQNFTVTVGTGSTTTAAGGDSWFDTNTTLMAKGGASVANNTSAGGAGGAGLYGSVTSSGGNGANGSTGNYSGGGGAGGGGNASAQNGGTSPNGGGDGGDGKTSSNNGTAGVVAGGGGGGAYRSGGTNKTGGNGANGKVLISWIPEMNIKGNAISITDGDTTPSTSDWTDFGPVNIGIPVTKTYTIENLGTGTLTIGAISFSGTNASEFTITSSPAASVAPGSSTTFTVSFNPTASGTRTAAISIVDNDSDENPYNFSLQGTGVFTEINVRGNSVDIVDGDTTPGTADWTDFGTTNVAAGTIPRTFTIQSLGTSALTVGSVAISGANAADFTVTTAPAGSVAGGSSTTFIVTFNPSAQGTRTATVSIANSDPDENPYVFAIEGTATDPEINLVGNGVDIASGTTTTATADNTDFGSANVTGATITKTFTIQNQSTGSMALSIGAITFSGANAADFTVTTLPSSSVAINGSTTFVVTFDPSGMGTRTATINIANNDGNESPYTFAIQGTGLDCEINLIGNANNIGDGDTTPSTFDNTSFGSTDIANGTITKVFTIQNTGNASMNMGTVTFTGTGAADFSVAVAPPAVIPSGTNITFSVTFNPSATGLRSATMNIPNSDLNENPYDIAIEGTGTNPEINVVGNAVNIVDGDTTPSTTDNTSFGTTDVQAGTIAKTFTIQNQLAGVGPLAVSGVTITGANASDFTVTAAPASSVANNSSTTFTVTFNPSAVGVRTATINIANDDANENPYDFAISGTGTDPEINLVGNGLDIVTGDTTPSTTDNTDFGMTDIGAGTITKTYTIQNKSTATMNLTLGTVTITGTNAADFSFTAPVATTVIPNGSTTFTVTFNPSAVGTRTATVNIPNNDSDESPYTFAVQGTGGDPEIDLKGNAVTVADGDTTPSVSDWTDYGNVEISAGTSTRTYTIYNSASASMPLSIGAITFSGTNAGDFSVTTPPASSVAIGGSTTMTVTFNPSATGTRSAMLNIVNNDANENPYNFNIQGTGTNPEIDMIGNLISIVDGDTTPSVSDNTDFGTVSIDAGSTLVTYTIQNTGTGTMNLGSVVISGANASDFSISTAPASTVAQGGSTSFIISFSPTTVGVKTATITIINDDANENPYDFAITGLGVRTYADTDGDGISDNVDVDDDNDGIPDVTENLECLTSPLATTVSYTFLNETFGAGTTKGLININVPGATCGYCYEDGVVGPNTTACPSQSSWILDDGEYVVTSQVSSTNPPDPYVGGYPAQPQNIHGDYAWNGVEDHTVGDVNGRMAVFNASFTPGTFYETAISGIIPNVPITYSFWVLNIMSKQNYTGSILPNITVEFIDNNTNTVISSYNTGDIGRCNGGTAVNTCIASDWQQYTTTVNLGTVTNFTIRFKNNSTGGGGNDLAIDDITLKQEYCDRDGDGIANMFDLDSDNDGIPDIEEAGYKNMSSGKGTMDRTMGTWADANGNGLADSIDAAIAAGTYSIPDTDGDGVKDFQDLDSDNDAIFDVDEANLLNGDGDINGDGFGDGPDTDKDGILDLFDTSTSFGTGTRPFCNDTDSDGTPDYRDLDSNNDGIKDIVGTLYASYDTDGDGKIDGSADVDKDGILDAFDTKTTALGSPRDLNKKLFLDFDGRNDYGEAKEMLSGLSKATIMGWIKLTNTFAATGQVIGEDNFNIKVTRSGSNNIVTATAKGITVSFATPISVDKWYHVCAVYDGSNATDKLKLYINGKMEATSNAGALAGALATSTAKFTFAKNATSATEYFKGSIDEVRVFITALSTDQVQKMVYQEIKQNGTAIRGEIVPKDIELSLWVYLWAYYRMDAYKDDVIDDYKTASIDSGSATNLARIYNNKVISYQLAPMPFVTTQSGALDAAVSQNNFVDGTDLYNYDWSILQVKHDITLPYNISTLGLFVDATKNLVLNNDNQVKNTWYMALNGKMDLQGRSQLVQTATSDLEPTSAGYIERDQQGQTNHWNYNYWSSPVGAISSTTNNNAFTVAGVMKDGTNPASPQNIQWTSGLNSSATSPITLSSYWIFKFQNVTNAYANWANVGPTGSLTTGQGFTLKGSSAATPTQNYVFVGKPNNGSVTIPIAANNLNLCGNPYASAIDAQQFITDNIGAITGTLYFWEHFTTNTTHVLADYQGGYATYTMVGGTPPVAPTGVSTNGSSNKTPGRFIPVGQGFFVTANTTGGNIKFNNAQRGFVKEDNVNSNTMFRQNTAQHSEADIYNNHEDTYESDTYGKIRLGYDAGNYHRQILLGFMDDKATAGIDPGYDAKHIDNQPNDMYFLNSGVPLNIEGDTYFNSADIFPLAVKTAAAGDIKITLDATENFDENQPIYIYDNVTQVYHDIRQENFELTVPAGGILDDRFSLRFTNGGTSLGVGQNTLESGIYVAYASANSIVNIKNNITDATVQTVSLYDMLGQSISSWDVANMDQHNIQIPVKNLATGTYIVKMKTTKGDISKKIIVK